MQRSRFRVQRSMRVTETLPARRSISELMYRTRSGVLPGRVFFVLGVVLQCRSGRALTRSHGVPEIHGVIASCFSNTFSEMRLNVFLVGTTQCSGRCLSVVPTKNCLSGISERLFE